MTYLMSALVASSNLKQGRLEEQTSEIVVRVSGRIREGLEEAPHLTLPSVSIHIDGLCLLVPVVGHHGGIPAPEHAADPGLPPR